MNAALKGLLLTSMLLTLVYSVFSFTGVIYGNFADNIFGYRDLQIYTYTQPTPEGNYKLTMRIYGIDSGETLIIYDIIINQRSVTNNPDVIFHESLPIKLTTNRFSITLLLKNYYAGQLTYIRLETNIGPIFLTIKV